MSANGTYQVAAQYGEEIWTSSDQGGNWIPRTALGCANWIYLAYSANGQQLVAAQLKGRLFQSFDAGEKWIELTLPQSGDLSTIVSSADGNRLALLQGDVIMTSKDSEVSWTQSSAQQGPWMSLAMSVDGMTLVAGQSMNDGGNGGIFLSKNFGPTWTQTAAHVGQWIALACNFDCTKILAA